MFAYLLIISIIFVTIRICKIFFVKCNMYIIESRFKMRYESLKNTNL